MRRVYYAFALRVASHPIVVHGTLFIAGVFVLSRFVHVASILNNISSVQVGELGRYLFNTFMHAEWWTLATIGIILFSVLSLPFSLAAPRFHKMQAI